MDYKKTFIIHQHLIYFFVRQFLRKRSKIVFSLEQMKPFIFYERKCCVHLLLLNYRNGCTLFVVTISAKEKQKQNNNNNKTITKLFQSQKAYHSHSYVHPSPFCCTKYTYIFDDIQENISKSLTNVVKKNRNSSRIFTRMTIY